MVYGHGHIEALVVVERHEHSKVDFQTNNSYQVIPSMRQISLLSSTFSATKAHVASGELMYEYPDLVNASGASSASRLGATKRSRGSYSETFSQIQVSRQRQTNPPALTSFHRDVVFVWLSKPTTFAWSLW